MAKRQKQRSHNKAAEEKQSQEQLSGYQVKERLGGDLLTKLKEVERQIKAERQREAEREQERKRQEQEERERNKSFGELLDEYEKKGISKYS
ncbi:YqkE family protein [Brevibacillus humidisoli]|uniref:DUF3886 domain-containing protein n=1 Tax=Brevibacillus humidisoli TaxID=2895522 RepID=UPI001E45C66A|nr:YqkE family protein [Brevibacillus humidisoli]UFJ41190.1 YqkE family protein [Brevibacillus humidisoli]